MKHTIAHQFDDQIFADFEKTEEGQRFLRTLETARTFTFRNSHGPTGDQMVYFATQAIAGDPCRALWALYCLGYQRGYALGVNRTKAKARESGEKADPKKTS